MIMLKIAFVARNYKSGVNHINYKFRDKIEKVNITEGIWILKNGDEIHLCYNNERPDTYKSFEFDALCIAPDYESLEDVIKYRVMR